MRQKRYGCTYYYFIFRDVLFLCLNTQDDYIFPDEGIRAEQIKWAKAVLKNNKHVRWTFVFMHSPLWVNDEKGEDSGFREIRKALKDREYTVFSGHTHEYVKYIRDNKDYYVLSTTGGGPNPLKGPEFGEFDHGMLVTMTGKGPQIINVSIDGLVDNDIQTEQMFCRRKPTFCMTGLKNFQSPYHGKLTISFKNPFPDIITGQYQWHFQNKWTVNPSLRKITLKPDQKKSVIFEINYSGAVEELFPLPVLETNFEVNGDEWIKEKKICPLEIRGFLRDNLPVAKIKKVSAMPEINGQLTDKKWTFSPEISQFYSTKLDKKPTVLTEAMIVYSEKGIYHSFRCHEPNLSDLHTEAAGKDQMTIHSKIFKDDAIELFFITDCRSGTFKRLVVNAAGTVYNDTNQGKRWIKSVQTSIGREKDAWTLEIFIPWTDLDIRDLLQTKGCRFQIARYRPQSQELLQWASTAGYNQPDNLDLLGILKFL